MPRTKKQPADPATTDVQADFEIIRPDTVIVNTESESPAPTAAPATAEEKTQPDKPARKPRTRRAPAKKKTEEPAAQAAPAPPLTPPPALILDDLAREAETLRGQLGDAGRQAEETRLLMQSWRHQHEEFKRDFEALHKQTGTLHQEAIKQAEELRAQLQSLKQEREEAGRELTGLRQQAEQAKAEFREAVQGSSEMRTHLQQATKQFGEVQERFRQMAEQIVTEMKGKVEPVGKTLREASPQLESFPEKARQAAEQLTQAEARFRETAQQMIEELRGQIQPLGQSLRQAGPQLESFSGEARQVLERIDQAARTLPDALRQQQRLELERLEAEHGLTELRQQAEREQSRLELLRREAREQEARLQETRQLAQEAEEKAKQAVAVVAVTESEELRPRLGITVGPGIVVDEVQESSAAQLAGMMAGDVIQAVNSTHVTDGAEVRELLRQAKGGEDVVVTVSRAGQDVDLTVHLMDPAAEAQEEGGRPWLGLTVHPGVVVAEVHPGSPAEAAGLARGDVIQAANGTPVNAGEQIRQVVLWEQLRQAVQAQDKVPDTLPPESEGLRLEVSRCGQVREVKVPLAQAPLSA